MDFQIEVNNKLISVNEGETLLVALRNNGFKIPTLCHMNRFAPTGACRLCVVEVEGKRDLITSCSYPAEKGMKVKTNSQRVMRARKSLVELLLSNHPDDCLYCQRNGNCELQWLAAEMNIKERKYFGAKNQQYPDYSSTSVARDPAKCVLCSRCVRICEEVQLVTAIDFISRGNQTTVNSAFEKGLNQSSCIHCGQCIQVCPTAALFDISHVEKVQAALQRKDKKVIFFISPSVIASTIQSTDLKPRNLVAGRLASALKRSGAFKVFDLGAASDIHILEEAEQLVDMLGNKSEKPFPLISSCCPSWQKYVEMYRPDTLRQLATIKSPQHIMGSMLKTMYADEAGIDVEQMYTVAVMPCLAKKHEASLDENTHKGLSEVDAVLTVRELFQLLKSFGLNLEQMEEDILDIPFDNSSAAACKLGYSGGKAEAVAAEVYRLMHNDTRENFKFVQPKSATAKKETKVQIGKKMVGFAWVSSIQEAEKYLTALKEEERNDIHYLEVMACPEGCAGGGGQPISRGFTSVHARKKICLDLEKTKDFSFPNQNPLIKTESQNKLPDRMRIPYKNWYVKTFNEK